jgi:ribosome biogenesis GTPase
LHQLHHLGWDATLEAAFEPFARQGLLPGRVAAEHTHLYRLLAAEGEPLASVTGRMRHDAVDRLDFPAVGDWVAFQPAPGEERAVIHAVLPRRSRFVRQAAGEAGAPQIVAANVDTVLLVAALDRDFNPRRLERYLTLAWDSGARPVIVLNKADLVADPGAARAALADVALGVPIHAVSGAAGEGLEALAPYLAPGRTIALLGSSGVGKSTLLNRLAGREAHATGAVRATDDRGRHTTTFRALVALPGGALAIDTPGMRELQLWEGAEGFAEAFGDVAAIAARCRFRDCAHAREPGCAVRAALETGELAPERLASYQKLARELAHQARKQDQRLALAEKARWKQIHLAQRRRPPKGSD